MNSFVNKRLYGEKERSALNFAINVILVILAVILAVEVLFGTIFTGIYVTGRSMLPTIRDGDYVYVNKYKTPKRGDIVVVYDNHENKRKNIIKRVLALGGDSVAFISGVFYLNGEPVEETYVDSDRNTGINNVYYNMPERVVKEGCLFLVGDNRNDSSDSRSEANGDYSLKYLVGVVPNWSLNIINFTTYWYNVFNHAPSGSE